MQGILRCVSRNDLTNSFAGVAVWDKKSARSYQALDTSKHFPNPHYDTTRQQFRTCQSVTAANGDSVKVQGYVILLTPSDDIQHGSPCTVVARVEEISAWQSSALQLRGHAELILVQHAHANRPASKYRMPYIDLSGKYYLVQPAVCDSLYDPDARACANLVVLSLKQSLL